MHKLLFFLATSTIFLQITPKTVEDNTSAMREIKAILSKKAAIAKERALIAKNILRIPVGVFCSAAPVFIFSHYAPLLASRMNLGTAEAIVFVGLGGLYTGMVSAKISFVFNKK